MNEELSTFARKYLKKNLSKLPEGYVNVFKLMYSESNPELSVEKVVDKMPEKKLDWAMSQVKNSLDKLGIKPEEIDNILTKTDLTPDK